jgi:serine/threonine-protein kinase RsbW
MTEPEQTPPSCEFGTDKLVFKLDTVIPSNIEVVDSTVAKIIGLIGSAYSSDDIERIDLALREALVNAIIHGNRSDPNKSVRVCVALQPDNGVIIMVKDSGSGFDPSRLPNPLVGQNLLASHGRGVFLINQLMEDVSFSFEHGTEIRMRQHPSSQSRGEDTED